MRSFTLIEIMVVIAIILILTVLVFPNFRNADSKFALDRSAYGLAQNLRNAEEMAMSSQTTPPEFGSTFFPRGGYGLYFQEATSSYILFADCDGDDQYDATGTAASCSEATGTQPFPEKIKDITLELGIKTGTLNPVLNDSLSVTFFPPDPTITIYPQPASTASIELSSGAQSKIISINSIGLIEIK